MKRQCLVALFVMTFAPLVNGQIGLPSVIGGKAKTEAAAPAPEAANPRAETEAQLAEARRQQEAEQLETGTTPPPGPQGLPITDRKRLFDRLVVAYSERLKLLDDLDRLGKSPPETSNQQALLAEFAGPPPYSALRVDALRDQHDATGERLRSLAAAERALEAQKLGLLDAQKRGAEALRLADDKLARAQGQDEKEKQRLNRELTALRLQLAEAELANIVIAVDRVRLEAKALQALTTEMQRLLARVVPEQSLSKEEFEQQQAQLLGSLGKVAAEVDRLVSDNNRRTAERERLAKLVASAGAGPDAGRRLQLLDERMDTDRVQLMTLSWLQTLLQAVGDAWAQRYVALRSQDSTTRQAVITSLSTTRDELLSRKQLVHELQQAARLAVREQELRLSDTFLDEAASADESARLDTLKQRLLAYQRVDLAAAGLERQLDRWLQDFGFQGKTASVENWQLGAMQMAKRLRAIWDFEMFAVEESTVVDGKTVAVSYGVTVGKSIGALLLFVFGYWLFSLLSARLQRIMVGRFKVNEQLASVIRRWAMISLAVILVIFILNLARIPLTVFAFLGGALAIGVGFGTQTIIKNVISGIIILFERKIRVGDIIALGGMTGHVTAVDLRASTVRGFDGVEALVPNSSFLENQVVNWTYSNPRIRREIRIGVAYGSPVQQAAEIIAGCAKDHGQVLRDPAPEVFFEDFADSALLLVLVFWVELGPTLVSRRVDSDLRYAMEKRLGAAGIPIPFPQRDVNLNVSQPLSVRLTPAPDTGR
ncbi:mechanosensitive ion channel domain-containing protein [Accumulibacter sp.]|uniref:mechanosensitive ion channel domain-containing protein n=1 Tax=Accumulibacter sp. TaxID=2053492 RepID=UPI00261FE95E|nr:mechanosensitive ion channel domain-containing protein [Accumulibacter sp.]